MLDLIQLERINQEATEREHRLLTQNIRALEVALHIPLSQTAALSWVELRKRLANLRSLAALKLRQEGEVDWSVPITHGEYLASKSKSKSFFHVERS